MVASGEGSTQTTPAPVVYAQDSGQNITAQLPGSVFAIKCKVGDIIKSGDTLIVLESMKMETEVKSHCDGKVQSILVKEGASVKTGDTLVTLG